MDCHKLQYAQCKIGEKTYGKYQVVVPSNIVQIAGWKANERISFQAGPSQPDGKRRIILTAAKPEAKVSRMVFEEFSDSVCRVLRSGPTQEWTWTKIRAANPDLPKKPHALWVHRMEAECGLKREKGPTGTVWVINFSETKNMF